mmetsp:Transcript_12781/g.22608  ORF Transcript_12781/g.22608 Transcript_12781/m.22608 type:complete len:221 (+) Transcript_12781:1218-1880(+)
MLRRQFQSISRRCGERLLNWMRPIRQRVKNWHKSNGKPRKDEELKMLLRNVCRNRLNAIYKSIGRRRLERQKSKQQEKRRLDRLKRPGLNDGWSSWHRKQIARNNLRSSGRLADLRRCNPSGSSWRRSWTSSGQSRRQRRGAAWMTMPGAAGDNSRTGRGVWQLRGSALPVKQNSVLLLDSTRQEVLLTLMSSSMDILLRKLRATCPCHLSRSLLVIPLL